MLADHRMGPFAGQEAKYHIVFLHSYGSGGKLMADYVGTRLRDLMPSARLYFPDAPELLGRDRDGNSYNRWFYVEEEALRNDAPDPDLMAKRATDAAAVVNAYIDRLLEEEGIAEDRLIIAGFSQGGTMAYYTALLRDKPVAGVFSLSGGALDRLARPLSRPPVVLGAGGQEEHDYCGVNQIIRTSDALKTAGFEAEYYIFPGQGHSISDLNLKCLAEFTCGTLPVSARYGRSVEDTRRHTASPLYPQP